jgi:hypothetical protein
MIRDHITLDVKSARLRRECREAVVPAESFERRLKCVNKERESGNEFVIVLAEKFRVAKDAKLLLQRRISILAALAQDAVERALEIVDRSAAVGAPISVPNRARIRCVRSSYPATTRASNVSGFGYRASCSTRRG